MCAHELCGGWALCECKCLCDTDEIKILFIVVLALGFVHKCGYSMIIQWPSWKTDIGDPEIKSLEQVVTDLQSTKLSVFNCIYKGQRTTMHIVPGQSRKELKINAVTISMYPVRS